MADIAPPASQQQGILVPNWRQGHKFATTWVAAGWSAFGAVLMIYPFFMQDLPIPMPAAGALFIAGSVAYGIARFTHQSGLE